MPVHEIMLPITYASSEGSDEPEHPRKIASALTAHIHRMNVDEGACRGCEFKNSKALEMLATSKLVCHSLLWGGGGVGAHSGSGTANSISRRQRDRVMVHGHV